MSLFTGEGNDREGTFISFTVVSGEGFFYAGQNEGIAIAGREYLFWFPGLTLAQAMFVLQTEVSTVNYKAVEKSTTYVVDYSDHRIRFSGYKSREAEIKFFDTATYSSVEEAESDIALFEKYNDWIRAGLLKPAEQHSYSEPEPNDSGSILNLTQHSATPDQVLDGVVEPDNKSAVQAALIFDAIPSKAELTERAELLARIALDSGCKKAMIGGAPFFMSTLEIALKAAGITPVYAFSVRDSVEKHDGNGGVTKTNVFRHVGFVGVVAE